MILHVTESGTPGAPSIVFLHGMGTSGWMWDEQVRHLQDFHCLNVDLPGHGKSNHIEWKSLADTADAVADTIRARATNQRAHIVGLSLGAYVTFPLLARHTSVVESAVLSGVTTGPMPRGKMMLTLARVMSLMLKNPLFIRFNARMLHIPDDVYDVYAEGLRAMSRQALLRVYEELIDLQLPERLKTNSVPTLIVAGEMEMQAVRDAVSTLASTLPNAEGRIVPGVHHGWNGEAPELFNAMVRAWISRTPLPDELTPSKPLLTMA